MIIATGAAVDVLRAHNFQQELQSSVDASTLYAASNLENDEFEKNSKDLFDANFESNVVLNVTDSYVVDSNKESVTGNASGDLKLTLASVFGYNTIPISATSVVKFDVDETVPCIYALRQSGTGMYLSNGTTIQAPTCRVDVHSTANPAFALNGAANIDVAEFCIAGDKIIDNDRNTDNINTSCEVDADPYAGAFEEPKQSDCYSGNRFFNNAEEIVLEPGTYCDNLFFNNSGVKVKLTGGEEPYILRNSKWFLNGGDWEGDNVSFYFADSNSKFIFNNGIKAKFTPPTSGPYEGVFMTEAPGLSNSTFILNDSRGFDWEGIVYLPSREFIMNGGATVRARDLKLVANFFRFNNGVTLNIEPNPANSEEVSKNVFYLGE